MPRRPVGAAESQYHTEVAMKKMSKEKMINFIQQYQMTLSEILILLHLRDIGHNPDSPIAKAIMKSVAVERLSGIAKTIEVIEKHIENPIPHEPCCFDEIEDQDKWIWSMKFQIGRMEEMLNQEGLRLGRPWGSVYIRIEEPDEESLGSCFVGYKLAGTIHPETDEKIRGEQIDDYHARRLFKKRNGGPEKPPEGSA